MKPFRKRREHRIALGVKDQMTLKVGNVMYDVTVEERTSGEVLSIRATNGPTCSICVKPVSGNVIHVNTGDL